ncbi:MAG: PIN domain-containing protein [Candidatus Aminicenantes bacterium]|nr:MAG: PIN domain-containing protein [Candidatus Aminicenantes bacterium]
MADNVGQHIISKNVIDGSSNIFIMEGVVVEIVYVLTKTYGINKELASDKLVELFEQKRFCFENKSLILEALNIFKERSLDFVDCLLCACKKLKNVEVFTFDEKLLKFLEEETSEGNGTNNESGQKNKEI